MRPHLMLLCCLSIGLIHCQGTEEDLSQDMSVNEEMSQRDQSAEEMNAQDMTTRDMAPDLSSDMMDDQGEEELLVIKPGPWDLSMNGPYNVGYQVTEVTYQARPEMTDRTLEVVIWYPTLIKKGRTSRYAKLFSRREAFNEAPLAPEQDYPVLIFSHGNGSLAEQSYYLTEYFASHGWVVIAPYHTGNTIRDGGSINYRSALYRPQDITALLDWMEALPEASFLKGRLSDKIALSGHSFGGYTTLASAGGSFNIDEIEQACQNNNSSLCSVFTAEEEKQVFRQGFKDTRIKAAIPHTPAGAFFFGSGLKDITIPTMVMTGAMDRTLTNQAEGDPIWQAMASDGHHVRLDFKKAGHFTFSNMCSLLPNIEQVANDGCSEDFISIDIALPIIRQYTLAFAQYHLLGDTRHEAWITGQTQPWSQHLDFSKK